MENIRKKKPTMHSIKQKRADTIGLFFYNESGMRGNVSLGMEKNF